MRFSLVESDRLIGKNLRAFRLARGLTQKALGARIGISNQQILKYERGDNRLSVSMSIALADVLDVPLKLLISHDPETRRAVATISEFEAIPPGAIKTALRALVLALGPSTEDAK